jgi:hypothetical protein
MDPITTRIRTLGWLGVAGGLAGLALGLKDQVVGPRVADTQLTYPAAPEEVVWTAGLLALVHAAAAAGTWAVQLAADAPRRRTRTALRAAAVGFLVMVPAELAYIPFRDVTIDSTPGAVLSGVLGAAAVVSGLGLTVAGADLVRGPGFASWRGGAVLASGLWPLLVVTPVFVTSGWQAWPLVGMQALMTAMSAAALAEAAGSDAASARTAAAAAGTS